MTGDFIEQVSRKKDLYFMAHQLVSFAADELFSVQAIIGFFSFLDFVVYFVF